MDAGLPWRHVVQSKWVPLAALVIVLVATTTGGRSTQYRPVRRRDLFRLVTVDPPDRQRKIAGYWVSAGVHSAATLVMEMRYKPQSVNRHVDCPPRVL